MSARRSSTLDEVTRLDCDLMQGFQLSKPIPPDELIRWLEQHQRLADKDRLSQSGMRIA